MNFFTKKCNVAIAAIWTLITLSATAVPAQDCQLPATRDVTYTYESDEPLPASVSFSFGMGNTSIQGCSFTGCVGTAFSVVSNVDWLTPRSGTQTTGCCSFLWSFRPPIIYYYSCFTPVFDVDPLLFPGSGATATIFINDGATIVNLTIVQEQPKPDSRISPYDIFKTIPAGTDHVELTTTVSNIGQPGSSVVFTAELYDLPWSPTSTIVYEYDGSFGMDPGPIEIKDATTADLYPFPLELGRIPGELIYLYAELNGLTHTNPDDLDILLEPPTGPGIVLLSDAGGIGDILRISPRFGYDIRIPGTLAPDADLLTSGGYAMTDYEPGETFPSPATSDSSGTGEDLLDVTSSGIWKLYIVDDTPTHSGELQNGWDIHLATKMNWAERVTVQSSGNPILAGTSELVTIRVDTHDLIPGKYRFQIIIMVSDAADLPQVVDVELTITV